MRWRAAILAMLVASCAEPDVGTTRAALGEPRDGFPTWEERVVFVWSNRARADPAADLASCTQCAERACYTPRPPLVWDHALARAARFHSDNLALAGCALQHDSPCTLVADLGTRYTPGTCNGAPSCACTGGTATCGSMGTEFGPRISLFGGSPRAENIHTGSDPVSVFYGWLHEPDSSTACGWRASNGHRANILSDLRSLGVGKTTLGGIWTQDFGDNGAPDGIVGGVHYPRTGPSVALRANWYRAGVTPASATVNVGGTCTSMTVERGSGDNGTYLANVSGLSGCTRYYFQFTTPAGDVFYPTTGSYGIECPEDWSSTRPPTCRCTPSCGGRACGDDGCGSSCGTCATDRMCSAAGACVCMSGRTDCGGACVDTTSDPANCGACGRACAASEQCTGSTCTSTCTPSCAGRSCGDDGCGGSCGGCPVDRTCDTAGSCACMAGRTDCSGSCIDTSLDPSHCGACDSPCASGEVCASGSCACVPSCAGRSCGADGCGGSCGSCATGRVCTGGNCECSSSATLCGAECVDVRIDEAHCGTCNDACAAGETCVASACTTAGPDAGCTPACAGRACGDDTCGGTCGTCSIERACANGGQCVCLAELTECAGVCVDTRSDAAHCGACDQPCASDQRCVGGACVGGVLRVDAGVLDAGVGERALLGTCTCRAAGAPAPRRAWLFTLLLAVVGVSWARARRSTG